MSLKQVIAGAALAPVMAVERIVRSGNFRTPVEEAQSILILEYMLPLGCCVHLTPLFDAIRAEKPHAVIAVATRGVGLDVLRHNAAIDHLIETPDPLHELRPAAKALSSELTKLRIQPDCILTGASDQRTRIGLMALLATGGWRAGFTQTPALYHQPLTVDREVSLIENNLRLTGLLKLDGPTREPRVPFSSPDVAYAEKLVREANPQGRPLLVMVNQTSGGQRTGWHRDRFVQIVHHARHELGCAVVYVGTAADAKPIEEIRLAADEIGVSLAGRTSVTQLAALLAMSDYVVSLDTGTMHVARAVGVPMVVLAPSWQKAIEWMPLGLPHVRILRGEDRDKAPKGYQLDEIEAKDVIRALGELIAKYPASWAQRAERVERSLSHIDHLPTLSPE
ncbi:glycosyltransferase family 9 protein [Granulicella aggregans]|uniref:glycosyltransferase family 9 protein n=1 Tax=Granulicella aggregans TaxID=474949 RepID=UPI0021E0A5CA|nr:glycosyltransferase family 9 protein [Granulicella aggregans]